MKSKYELKPTDDYIDKVYKEAKERQKHIERIWMDISMRMYSLHNQDQWKRWETYQHIDRTMARANENINKWKDTAWPRIRFFDDITTATTSSSNDDNDDADLDDEYAKLGTAAPKL